MAANRGTRDRRVFVGNIPYDATEEQLIEVFREAGPVAAFRLIQDTNGKPKGYGFCEYKDPETALSAIRNLNGTEMNGRSLRVDFAEAEKPTPMTTTGPDRSTGPNQGPPNMMGSGATGDRGFPPGNAPMHGGQQFPYRGGFGSSGPVGSASSGGSLHPGSNPPPNTQPPPPTPAAQPPQESKPPTEAVKGTLEAMSPSQVHDLMNHMKELIERNPDQARSILKDNPQLSYALLHIQIILGIASPEAAKEVLVASKPPPQTTSSSATPLVTPPAPIGGSHFTPTPSSNFPPHHDPRTVPPAANRSMPPSNTGPAPRFSGGVPPAPPHIAPRDPRADPREYPRGDPRDPRVDQRGGDHPRGDPRDPRVDQRGDPRGDPFRGQDPRGERRPDFLPPGNYPPSNFSIPPPPASSGPPPPRPPPHGRGNFGPDPRRGGQAPPPPLTPSDPEQQHLLQQVINMTPEQIQQLPPQQRQQVQDLQKVFAAGNQKLMG